MVRVRVTWRVRVRVRMCSPEEKHPCGRVKNEEQPVRDEKCAGKTQREDREGGE